MRFKAAGCYDEAQIPKQKVAGSRPVSRSIFTALGRARVPFAQANRGVVSISTYHDITGTERSVGHVWVWHIDTAGVAVSADAARSLLPDEGARAARFRFDEHRDQWIATRLALRKLLSIGAGLPVKEIEIRQAGTGKPAVSGFPWLKFSVSHTRGLSVIVIARDIEVGVDAEQITASRVDIAAARLVMSEEEVRDILSQPEGDARNRRFFERWTLKEAYGKWLGRGLTSDLTSVTVPLQGRVVTGPRECNVALLALPSGYAGALCTDVGAINITVAEYPLTGLVAARDETGKRTE